MPEPLGEYSFNIIKRRGDPTWAITLSGHRVEKQDFVYLKDHNGEYQTVKCADYHNEHFVYIDPDYNEETAEGQQVDGKKGWFAMCTCGSPAVLVGGKTGALGSEFVDYREETLVCMVHTQRLLRYGKGWHQGQSERRW